MKTAFVAENRMKSALAHSDQTFSLSIRRVSKLSPQTNVKMWSVKQNSRYGFL